MVQPSNRRLATEAFAAGKQDSATLAAATAAHVSDGSALDVALRAAFVSSPDRSLRTPLDGIRKAVSGPFRVLQIGTSIANLAYSPNHVMVEELRRIYGASLMTRFQAGYLSGSYTNAVNGWLKQPFSGVSYVRLRGSNTSTALTNIVYGYGDQIVIEWSQEPDGGAAGVLVDGVSVGSFGAAGTQQFGMQTVFTVTKGYHTVTINQPTGAWYSYPEAFEIRDSARRGVETIDGTYGGSSLANAATVQTASGNQVAGVATAQGAGIAALCGRSDVDLIIMSFTVNDAGYNPADPTAADYRQLLNAAVVAARAQNTPVVLIIEPAGSYALNTPNGVAANHTRYEAIKAHQQAVATLNRHVFIADWDTATRMTDLAAYAATYYPAVTGLNVAAGTFTGDFIHPDGSLTNSSEKAGTKVLATTLGISSAAPAETTALAVEMASYSRIGASLRPYGQGVDGAFPRRADVLYRNTAATNLNTGLNTAITGAGTSDANGKYLLANNYNFFALGATNGTQRMLTITMGPNDSGLMSLLGSDSGLHLYDPLGVEMGAVYTQRQIHFSGVPAGTIVTIAVLISQDASNKYLTINGRVYEAAVTNSPVPLLVNAP